MTDFVKPQMHSDYFCATESSQNEDEEDDYVYNQPLSQYFYEAQD